MRMKFTHVYQYSRNAYQSTELKNMYINSSVNTKAVIVLLQVYVVLSIASGRVLVENKKESFASCPHPHSVWRHTPLHND